MKINISLFISFGQLTLFQKKNARLNMGMVNNGNAPLETKQLQEFGQIFFQAYLSFYCKRIPLAVFFLPPGSDE